jgi:hypothetical protein
MYTKMPLNYQMTLKYTGWPNIFLCNVHKINQQFPFQGPPTFTQIVCFFGLKIHLHHLATLARSTHAGEVVRPKPRSPQCERGFESSPVDANPFRVIWKKQRSIENGAKELTQKMRQIRLTDGLTKP